MELYKNSNTIEAHLIFSYFDRNTSVRLDYVIKNGARYFL